MFLEHAGPMRIVQISDTHLSHLGGITTSNLQRLIAFINDELRPDVVVHTGDMLILDPDSAADRAAARELCDTIRPPLYVVPGNHDVGEPHDRPWGGLHTTSERVAGFASVFGPGYWLEPAGGYALIGLSSEIMSSGLPEEQAQWDWLATVPALAGGRPALVFTHKPVFPHEPGPANPSLSIPDAERERLLGALGEVNVRVFANGHLHRFAIGRHGDALTVTAPSTAFVTRTLEDLAGPGLRQLGVVEYECADDGTVGVFFRSVPGLTEGGSLSVEQVRVTAAEIGVALTG
jgi:3',5'-cyclic AMP phosphodiesterase CpdA